MLGATLEAVMDAASISQLSTETPGELEAIDEPLPIGLKILMKITSFPVIMSVAVNAEERKQDRFRHGLGDAGPGNEDRPRQMEWTNHEECLSRGLHIIRRRKQELYQHNGISTLGLGLVISPYIRQAPAQVTLAVAENRERKAQPSYVI